MAPQVKMLAANSDDDLDLVPRTHKVEGGR